ncbi:hypothetical protein CsSME_00020827 [Camellia sinensis var. sinensis]
MHACSAPLRNPPPCTSCLWLHCSASLKTAQVPRMLQHHSLITVEGHRLRGMVTGHEPCFDSSRGQTRHGNAFHIKCLHNQRPYHVMDSREFGPRPSDHQSRISMHDGSREGDIEIDRYKYPNPNFQTSGTFWNP